VIRKLKRFVQGTSESVFEALFLLSIITCSSNVNAVTEHECLYKNIDIKILTEEENDIELNLSTNGVKFASCKLRVNSFDDGTRGVSTMELIRFEKISCDATDTALAAQIHIIDIGFIKTSVAHQLSAAYVIKNEQPLSCKATNMISSPVHAGN
jgi:hypothetical protein